MQMYSHEMNHQKILYFGLTCERFAGDGILQLKKQNMPVDSDQLPYITDNLKYSGIQVGIFSWNLDNRSINL